MCELIQEVEYITQSSANLERFQLNAHLNWIVLKISQSATNEIISLRAGKLIWIDINLIFYFSA